MTKKVSAGLLLYKKVARVHEVFLVHPGGPLWKNKDNGAWSIPKGEFEEKEAPLEAAKREFFEETGKKISGKFIPLKPVITKSGKTIYAWAIEKDIETADHISNLFPDFLTFFCLKKYVLIFNEMPMFLGCFWVLKMICILVSCSLGG